MQITTKLPLPPASALLSPFLIFPRAVGRLRPEPGGTWRAQPGGDAGPSRMGLPPGVPVPEPELSMAPTPRPELQPHQHNMSQPHPRPAWVTGWGQESTSKQQPHPDPKATEGVSPAEAAPRDTGSSAVPSTTPSAEQGERADTAGWGARGAEPSALPRGFSAVSPRHHRSPPLGSAAAQLEGQAIVGGTG